MLLCTSFKLKLADVCLTESNQHTTFTVIKSESQTRSVLSQVHKQK